MLLIILFIKTSDKLKYNKSCGHFLMYFVFIMFHACLINTHYFVESCIVITRIAALRLHVSTSHLSCSLHAFLSSVPLNSRMNWSDLGGHSQQPDLMPSVTKVDLDWLECELGQMCKCTKTHFDLWHFSCSECCSRSCWTAAGSRCGFSWHRSSWGGGVGAVAQMQVSFVKVVVEWKAAPLLFLSTESNLQRALWPHPLLRCRSQRLRRLFRAPVCSSPTTASTFCTEMNWFPVVMSCGWLTFEHLLLQLKGIICSFTHKEMW